MANNQNSTGLMQYEKYFPLIILIFALPLIFFQLGALGLVGPDEPRYAQVAREMFERHDLITPTLLGDTWFEKPALSYWLMMICYRLIGVNEWAARLPNAILATLNLLIIYYTAKRAGGSQYGLLAALVLVSAGLYFGLARAASFDLPLTFTFTLALSCFYLADITEDKKRRRYLLFAFYASVGLSMLAKGLVGLVLMGAILLAYLILTNQWRNIFQLQIFSGFLIFCLVAATWYVPVIIQHGQLFIDEFFIQHHFQRFTSNKYHHPGPIYFFVLIILAGIFPWTAFLLAGVVRAIKNAANMWQTRTTLFSRTATKPRLILLATLWVVIPLAFFSLSTSKLPGYILPVFPGLALLVAQEVDRLFSTYQEMRRWILLSISLILLIGIGLAIFSQKEYGISTFAQASLLSTSLLAMISLIVAYRKQHSLLTVLTMLLFSSLLAINIALFLFVGIENKASLVPLARLTAENLKVDERLLFFNYQSYTPFFYTNGRIVHDNQAEAIKIYQREELAQNLAGHESMLCIMPEAQLKEVTDDQRFTTKLIGRQRNICLIRISLRKD